MKGRQKRVSQRRGQPQQQYLALFVNQDKESKQVRKLLTKYRIAIPKIEVKDQSDVPRLVTSERVFMGVRGIKEYLDNWTKVEKMIAAE